MGLLDVYARSASPGYAQKRDAQEYSNVWREIEQRHNEQGTRADQHPMRTAEMLLRSGNPQAMDEGNKMMQQYHSGKTADIKNFEYGMGLPEDMRKEWMRLSDDEKRNVIGDKMKFTRPDGTPGWGIISQEPDGSLKFHDAGVNAYEDPIKYDRGGGTEGIYHPSGAGTGPTIGTHTISGAPATRHGSPQPTEEPAGAVSGQGRTQARPGITPAKPFTPRPGEGEQVPASTRTGGPTHAEPPPSQAAQPQVASSEIGQPVVPEEEYFGRERRQKYEQQMGTREADAAADRKTALKEDMVGIRMAQTNHHNMSNNVDDAIDTIFDAVVPEYGWDDPQQLGDALNQIAGLKNEALGKAYDWKNLVDFVNSVPVLPNLPPPSAWPETHYQKLYEQLNTIKANLGFDKLQQMRHDSPTGGALGQVSDFENRMLQQTVTSLSQANDMHTMLTNLAKIKKHYDRVNKLSQVNFLVKHKYMPEGRGGDAGNYKDMLDAQILAVTEVFGGNDPYAQEITRQIMELY